VKRNKILDMANNLKDIYVGVKKTDTNRRKNDFYPTPPLATYVLQKYVNLPHVIVEPCAGRGNISIELLRHGYDVRSYDLHEYDNSLCAITVDTDFMSLQKPSDAKGLVTNPPYHQDLPRKIAEKAVNEYDFVAMFVRITFLEGKKRKKLFTNNPPSDIIFMSDRVKFSADHIEPINKNDQIGGMIAYCWIVWNKEANHTNTKCQWVTLDEEYEDWRLHYEVKI